ncbi:porin family protein [Flavivirga spongiicola]|uniref:PorT family protein n=1 Tax=Flavivirga spongiicola TaxID=421621 RepID=A0ABU7XMB1_9FLAO|nr:porin family protein [Flavivirga sp. MEBiC05379]MDO5981334.1 porin family protein [Flavivirga sp. MEBiC05379]
MKRTLLCTVIVLFGLLNINAQEIQFGGKAGVSFASLKVKNQTFSITNSETGFYVGGFAEIGVFDGLTFRPELLYIAVEDLNQISIPLMVKYEVSDVFNILAGPSFGYLLDVNDGFKSFNYGIEIGAAYDIYINRSVDGLFVEARYNFGLANLIEDAPSGITRKLSSLFVGLGYRFK